jgi:hypothetical protein
VQGRQIDQLDMAIVAGQPGFDLFRVVVAGVVQHHPDRGRRRMSRLQVLELLAAA